MRHTPGPWHVKQCDGFEGISDINDVMLASAYARVGVGQMKANAKLIAAAPTMLYTLQIALQALLVADTVCFKHDGAASVQVAQARDLIRAEFKKIKTEEYHAGSEQTDIPSNDRTDSGAAVRKDTEL